MSKEILDQVKTLARGYGFTSFDAVCKAVGIPETTLRRYLMGQFPMTDPLGFIASCQDEMGLTDRDAALLCVIIAPITTSYTVQMPPDLDAKQRAKVLIRAHLGRDNNFE